MAFKLLIVAFSVLQIARASLGEADCKAFPIQICKSSLVDNGIPTDVAKFNEYCLAVKSRVKCIGDWQEKCGSDRIRFFETPEIFQATFETISDICEEGTLLNTVVTENLKCYNETFEKSSCHEAADEFLEPFIRALEGSQPKFSIYCLAVSLVSECVIRELSESCGKLVEEASLEVLQRSKIMENACSVKEARSVLDELEDLGLDEQKKAGVRQLLVKLVE